MKRIVVYIFAGAFCFYGCSSSGEANDTEASWESLSQEDRDSVCTMFVLSERDPEAFFDLMLTEDQLAAEEGSDTYNELVEIMQEEC